MVGFRFSDNYEAVKSRIRRLPKLIEDSADTFTKKDAVGVIEAFQDGIREDGLNLEQLQPQTVIAKQREGFTQPETPLYGEGDANRNSYINMFGIRKIKKGYRVYARWARHRSGLPLRDLFLIHERGALIGGPGGAVIRIPPRPAFNRAFARYLEKRLEAENVEAVQEAIRQYLETGVDAQFREIIAKDRETDQFDAT